VAFQAWQRDYQQLIWQADQFRFIQGLNLLGVVWSLGIIWSALRVLVPARALASALVMAAISLAFTFWSIRP
jgi:membrane glycosyltransferase